jgi:hypothetical protein
MFTDCSVQVQGTVTGASGIEPGPAWLKGCSSHVSDCPALPCPGRLSSLTYWFLLSIQTLLQPFRCRATAKPGSSWSASFWEMWKSSSEGSTASTSITFIELANERMGLGCYARSASKTCCTLPCRLLSRLPNDKFHPPPLTSYMKVQGKQYHFAAMTDQVPPGWLPVLTLSV